MKNWVKVPIIRKKSPSGIIALVRESYEAALREEGGG